MKHILDSSFRYKPSFDTDVRKTFERIRRQQQAKTRDASKGPELRGAPEARDGHEVRVKVLQLDHLKKTGS